MKRANAESPEPVEIPRAFFVVEGASNHFSAVDERNVFRPWQPPAEPAPAPAAAAAPNQSSSGQLQQKAAAFKLTGVYFGDEPEALVEATDEKRTYTLKAGSEIRGIKVKEVKEDGVVFTDGQSEFLLK